MPTLLLSDKLGHHAAVLIEEQGVDGQLQIAVGI